MLLARNAPSFSLSACLACCALQSPRSVLGFTPRTRLQMEPGPPCLELNHRSCVSDCVLSQSYIYVVVRLEDRCFLLSPLLFFFNTIKEKHTHLPELGVLSTAERCDGCARASFHQNIKPWGWLLPFILVIWILLMCKSTLKSCKRKVLHISLAQRATPVHPASPRTAPWRGALRWTIR